MALVYNTSTTSKRSLWPPEHVDLWAIDARDARLRLSDGIWRDDWASALGAQTLGYGAFSDHLMQFQPCASLPWEIERAFADEFCEAMNTEAVRFFKSGSDAVSCAVRLARAYTGRKYVVAYDKCYHGTGDWHGSNLWTQGGTIDEHLVVHPFGEWTRMGDGWNEVAAIVIEPVPKSITLPPNGWLQHLREVCDEHGIILITDEVILGYRHDLRGFLASTGISAELRCYGKAMAQGAALSACAGSRSIMELLHTQVHFSGTANGEPGPLLIAQQTLKCYQENDVCGELAERGAHLKQLLHGAGFETRGLDTRFEVTLPGDRMDWVRACWETGILFPGWCSMSLAHTRGQMERLVKRLGRIRDAQTQTHPTG